jgi:pimeloyl-ACP methyl ester carboxylesterase
MARSSPTMAKPLISRSLIKTAISDIIYKKEALSEQQIDAYWMPLEQPGGKEAFLELLQMFDNKLLEKMQESFHRIKVPTLIIWGDHDRLIPVAHATLFHQEIPNAELMIIKDCGHIPQEEEPDLVNSRLLDFLHKSV